jgi:hypothetical protein
MYRTNKIGKYCWARFDTELLHGVGLVEDSRQLWGSDVYLSVNGTQIKIKNLKHVQYASSHEGFKTSWGSDKLAEASKAQKNRDIPAICLKFNGTGRDPFNDAQKILNATGTVILESRKGSTSYFILDASAIDWFAADY